MSCPGGSPTGTDSLLWISPSFGFADWIELQTILSPGHEVRTAESWSLDYQAVPVSTMLGMQRALVLLFAHHLDAHQAQVPGGGRRTALHPYLVLTRRNHARSELALNAVRDRLRGGDRWLEGSGDPYRWALAQWRGLAMAGSWVRTRDSSLAVRIADRHQAAALHASAEVIGFPLRRENGRREGRHRLVIDPQQVPIFQRLVLEPPLEQCG